MDIVSFVEYLVKGIVKEPDMVSVKQFDDEDGYIVIQVLVNNDDMGTVIGRSGATANAIRSLVQLSAYQNQLPKVKINFDSF